MKKIIISFIILFLGVYTYSQTVPCDNRNAENSMMMLDEIPDWILKNIQFPQEAYKYGIVGTEQLCVSVSWDGKVFISSNLNTLNPAFEDEIIRVVGKAPRCMYAGKQAKDVYKYMLIDFCRYIPEDSLVRFHRITLHTPPRLADIPSSPFDSRDKLAQWIHGKIQIPSALKGYVDTILYQYTVDKGGRMRNASVIQCKSDIVKSALEIVLKEPLKWKPAIADRCVPVEVTQRDRVIVKTDGEGRLLPFEKYLNDVFRNAKTLPVDSDILVLNPEIKPIYQGKHTFLHDITQGINVDGEIQLNGSFVIEKDGTVSHVDISNNSCVKIDSIVTETIDRTKWVAAIQGGNPVRTLYSFGINKKPQKKYRKDSYYDIYGKYFIYLQANPARTSHVFIRRDGTVDKYPFNNQGLFDYDAYYKGMLFYYKNASGKTGNISREYFKRLYKLYVND